MSGLRGVVGLVADVGKAFGADDTWAFGEWRFSPNLRFF